MEENPFLELTDFDNENYTKNQSYALLMVLEKGNINIETWENTYLYHNATVSPTFYVYFILKQ